MTLRIAALALLTVALGLAGCRDALIDEPLPADDEDPPTEMQLTVYLKGPTELGVGMTTSYRAEAVPGAVSYLWLLTGGDGRVTGVPTDDQARLYDITGVSVGSVQLTVRAIGEGNELLGVGSKAIHVTG
jgi:hypothetical protein